MASWGPGLGSEPTPFPVTRAAEQTHSGPRPEGHQARCLEEVGQWNKRKVNGLLLSLHLVCGFHGAPSVFTSSRPGGHLGDLGCEAAGIRKGSLGGGSGRQGGLGHLKNQIQSWPFNAFCQP